MTTPSSTPSSNPPFNLSFNLSFNLTIANDTALPASREARALST
jgi:hypothetical protein